VAAQALEQSVLESKDKDQLLAIAKALGVKATARSKKADIIDQILETTGAGRSSTASKVPAESDAPSEPTAPTTVSTAPAANGGGDDHDAGGAPTSRDGRADPGITSDAASQADGSVTNASGAPESEPPAEWELLAGEEGAAPGAPTTGTSTQRRVRRRRRPGATIVGSRPAGSAPGSEREPSRVPPTVPPLAGSIATTTARATARATAAAAGAAGGAARARAVRTARRATTAASTIGPSIGRRIEAARIATSARSATRSGHRRHSATPSRSPGTSTCATRATASCV
jgi:hypothetical protein